MNGVGLLIVLAGFCLALIAFAIIAGLRSGKLFFPIVPLLTIDTFSPLFHPLFVYRKDEPVVFKICVTIYCGLAAVVFAVGAFFGGALMEWW